MTARKVLAEYRRENGAYRKITGGSEHPATMPLVFRMADMRTPGARELTQKEREQLSPPPAPPAVIRTWEDYSGPELAKMKREQPARYKAIRAERNFRLEARLMDVAPADIVPALNKRRRPDLVARFTELREALRQ